MKNRLTQARFLPALQRLRVYKYRLLSSIQPEGDPKLLQPALFMGEGTISFGSGVVIGNLESPSFLNGYCLFSTRSQSARISVGNNVWMNNSVSVICNNSSVCIGDNSLIGYNVEILDSDFHGIDPSQRKTKHAHGSPVIICENVWIGSNAKILKGVTIGSNTVIGNGALVSTNIPANTVAVGVPARVIRTLVNP
jgi:galactoside O-acetyltransferase